MAWRSDEGTASLCVLVCRVDVTQVARAPSWGHWGCRTPPPHVPGTVCAQVVASVSTRGDPKQPGIYL